MRITEAIARLEGMLRMVGDLNLQSSGEKYSGDFEDVHRIEVGYDQRYSHTTKEWENIGEPYCRISG